MKIKVVNLYIDSKSPFEVTKYKVNVKRRVVSYKLHENVIHRIKTGKDGCNMINTKYKTIEVVKSNSVKWIRTEVEYTGIYIKTIECAHELLELEIQYKAGQDEI